MPRTGISYDDVSDSIHTLEKAGLKPSIRLIREKLGKGSLTTIAEHKRRFESERDVGPSDSLPDPIARGLLVGAGQYWQELVDAAELEIDATRQAADSQVEELKTRLDTALQVTSTLQDELGSKLSAMDRLEKSLK